MKKSDEEKKIIELFSATTNNEEWRLRLALLKKNGEYREFWDKYGGKKFLDAYFAIDVDLPVEKKVKTSEFIAAEDFISELTRFGIYWPFMADDKRVMEFMDLIDPFSTKDLPDPLPFPVFQKYPSVAGVVSENSVPSEAQFRLNEKLKLRPSERLLRIDLSRSRGELLNDFKRFLDRVDYFRNTEDCPKDWKENYQEWKPNKSRFRTEAWKAHEVWDLWEEAGKTPAIQTFKYISKKVGRPLSTVKSQWYQAHEKIKGRPYDPKAKYSTEKKRRDADQLCSKCPHGAICYKKSGEWIPCQEYLKIAGLEKGIKTVEYMDDIFYSQGGRKKPHLTSDKQ